MSVYVYIVIIILLLFVIFDPQLSNFITLQLNSTSPCDKSVLERAESNLKFYRDALSTGMLPNNKPVTVEMIASTFPDGIRYNENIINYVNKNCKS